MGTMVAEFSWWVNAHYSQTFELEMAAQPVLVKVCLSSVEIPEGGILQAGASGPNFPISFGVFIDRIKRKTPDGNIQVVDLHTNVAYDDNMTYTHLYVFKKHVTLGTPPTPTSVWALFTFEFWR